MVMEEIYLLTKHANFSSDYIENIAIYKRRYYLDLLKKELEETKNQNDKAIRKAKVNNKVPSKRRR